MESESKAKKEVNDDYVKKLEAIFSPSKERIRVFVSGPLNSSGVAFLNVREAVLTGMLLRRFPRVVPFIPHLFSHATQILPESGEFWQAWDDDELRACDVLVRIPGDSKGADHEVSLFESLGGLALTLSEFIGIYAAFDPYAPTFDEERTRQALAFLLRPGAMPRCASHLQFVSQVVFYERDVRNLRARTAQTEPPPAAITDSIDFIANPQGVRNFDEAMKRFTSDFEAWVTQHVPVNRRVHALGLGSEVLPLITRLVGATGATVRIRPQGIIGLEPDQLAIVWWLNSRDNAQTDEGRKLVDALRSAVYRAMKEPGAEARLAEFEGRNG